MMWPFYEVMSMNYVSITRLTIKLTKKTTKKWHSEYENGH